MALNATSLRFVVEVSADQATGQLKTTAAAFNEVAANARASMGAVGAASKAAGTEIVSLGDKAKALARDQRSEARATQFYVAALAEIVPVSNTAKIALAGLGEVLIGGVGIGAAIALVTAGIKLMADAWREADAASRDALDSGARRIDAITKRVEDLTAKQRTDSEVIRDRARLVAQQIQEREAAIPILRSRATSEWRGLTGKTESQIAADKAEAELAQLRREYEALLREIQATIESSDRAFAVQRQKKADSKAQDDLAKRELQRLKEERDRALYADQGFAELEAGSYQRDYNTELKKTVDLTKQWDSTLASATTQLLLQETTAGEVGKQIMRMVVNQAVTSVIARALSAGAGAAESQAAVPIVGPGLAAAAQANTVAMVLGLLNSMPSARGGWDVPAGYNGLAMIHEREMVLPEKYADVLRSGGGGPTYNVYALDPRGVERVLTDNDGAVARAERKRLRRGSA